MCSQVCLLPVVGQGVTQVCLLPVGGRGVTQVWRAGWPVCCTRAPWRGVCESVGLWQGAGRSVWTPHAVHTHTDTVNTGRAAGTTATTAATTATTAGTTHHSAGWTHPRTPSHTPLTQHTPQIRVHCSCVGLLFVFTALLQLRGNHSLKLSQHIWTDWGPLSVWVVTGTPPPPAALEYELEEWDEQCCRPVAQLCPSTCCGVEEWAGCIESTDSVLVRQDPTSYHWPQSVQDLPRIYYQPV